MIRSFLKKHLPKTLFARTLLILIVPILLVQLISAYIFFERHWDEVTRRLAKGTATQIAMTLEFAKLKKILPLSLDLKVTYQKDVPLSGIDHKNINVSRFEHASILRTVFKRDFWEIFLIEALQGTLQNPFHVRVKRHVIYVEVSTSKGLYTFEIQRRHIFTGTTVIFMLWSIGTTILLLLIAIAFLRNQIRPILKLSEAAEKFGTYQVFSPLSPSGAIEVRKASIAFLNMRERILSQIKEHTQMLAGVSHDLRTPLTRMRLQLALMESSLEVEKLLEDVAEMESMIESYLNFAKSGDYGPFENLNIIPLIQDVVAKNLPPFIQIHWPEKLLPVFINAWGPALRRALTNVLQNAQKFGNEIWVSWKEEENFILIYVEDDGPGVPANAIEEIFKPFYRVEGSRNRQTGGVGLGLAVARNIARSHGGEAYATPSSHGGLCIKLSLKKDPR